MDYLPKFTIILILTIAAASDINAQEVVNIPCTEISFAFQLLKEQLVCEIEDDSFSIVERNTSANFLDLPAHAVGLVAHNKNIKFIPSFDVESFEKGFIGLSLVHCHVQEVTQADMENFPALEHLDLSGNEIQHLGAELFKFNPKLEFIDLNNNQMKSIDVKAFVGLRNLQFLDLENVGVFNGIAKTKSEVPRVVAMATVGYYSGGAKLGLDLSCLLAFLGILVSYSGILR